MTQHRLKDIITERSPWVRAEDGKRLRASPETQLKFQNMSTAEIVNELRDIVSMPVQEWPLVLVQSLVYELTWRPETRIRWGDRND